MDKKRPLRIVVQFVRNGIRYTRLCATMRHARKYRSFADPGTHPSISVGLKKVFKKKQ